jgi:shikimate dehydrogenase
MRKYGLIGYPLGHSFSKKYFTEKFHNENISDCSYENFPLESISGLQRLIVEEPELLGLNVTIPYKSDVIRFLNKISPEAEEIGAVNVIKLTRHAETVTMSGFNSDVTGIRDSIFPYLKDYIRRALVLGSGGSSRSVCYVLEKAGIDVIPVSRNKKPGLITYSEIDKEMLKSTFLIINTTPLGMYPDTDSKPDINYRLLGSRHILFDLVYNPEQTSFLKAGAEQGCFIINGIKMLHSQAEKAWEIWNDNNI